MNARSTKNASVYSKRIVQMIQIIMNVSKRRPCQTMLNTKAAFIWNFQSVGRLIKAPCVFNIKIKYLYFLEEYANSFYNCILQSPCIGASENHWHLFVCLQKGFVRIYPILQFVPTSKRSSKFPQWDLRSPTYSTIYVKHCILQTLLAC